MEGLIEGILALVVFVAIPIIYFLPGIIANRKKHPSSTLIAFINLFFGWTIGGWFLCFLWSISTPAHNPVASQQAQIIELNKKLAKLLEEQKKTG